MHGIADGATILAPEAEAETEASGIAWNRLETRFLKSRVWNRCGNSRFEVGIVLFTDRERLLHCRASVREEDETHVFV